MQGQGQGHYDTWWVEDVIYNAEHDNTVLGIWAGQGRALLGILGRQVSAWDMCRAARAVLGISAGQLGQCLGCGQGRGRAGRAVLGIWAGQAGQCLGYGLST